MIKKLLALLLALAVTICCAACVAESKEEEKKSETEAAVQTDPATEPSEEATQPTEPAVTTPVKKVDTAKLKSIELQDNFPVKVTSVESAKGYFAEGREMYTVYEFLDASLVTVKNETGGKITGISILVLATKEGKEVKFNEIGANLPKIGEVEKYSSYVKLMGVSDISIANEASEAYSLQCALSLFDNLNIIVYSYTDEAGNEVINENCKAWLENTLPV